ncbi:MAG: phosphoenolpyruvate carboxykinase domain-containing protein [Marmoricola sp.]
MIFGGRTRDREPLVRAIDDVAEGVYDGLTLGAEATFAAEGVEGQLRYDPMSMRPFMSYPEADYAAHWLKIIGAAKTKPIFAHVNWFQRDAEDGHFLWPGYRDNLRALLWLMEYHNGEVTGRKTAVGVIPTKDELGLEGCEATDEDLDRLLTIDVDRWKQELANREVHLKAFTNLPEEIWEAHNRVVADLEKSPERLPSSCLRRRPPTLRGRRACCVRWLRSSRGIGQVIDHVNFLTLESQVESLLADPPSNWGAPSTMTSHHVGCLSRLETILIG